MHEATQKNEGRLLLGQWSRWMPRVAHNAIFAFKASSLLENGYTRVGDKTGQHNQPSVFCSANMNVRNLVQAKNFPADSE
jgi:hypothetical protein